MALPQQVIDSLSKEPPKTPGWSVGMLMFSGGVLFIAILIYAGLAFGYEPFLNSKINSVTDQINTVAQSISPGDQTKLVTYYSEIANVRTALANHVSFSNFLTWFAAHTEANVYFNRMTFSSGNQVSLSGVAANEEDVNQQVAIFQSSPDVQSVSVQNVSLPVNTSLWQFTMSLVMQSGPSSVLAANPQTAPASSSSTTQ